MIEHVRRRALKCEHLSKVIVATCDEEIGSVVRSNGGNVIMTSRKHLNGTTRVAEAVSTLECTHVILLQGDEPLVLPRHIEKMVAAIEAEPDVMAWNLVGQIERPDELDKSSFVKCSVNEAGEIFFCFRRSPYFSEFNLQRIFTRKMLGILAYRKDFLLKLVSLPPSPSEQAESIEQIRIIENGYRLGSVEVSPSLPSVNEPSDLESVIYNLNNDSEQVRLLEELIKVR